MRYEIRSIKGSARDTNHDFAGASFDGTRGLFVIVDGTSKPGSEQLAQRFVHEAVRTYQSCREQCADNATHTAAEHLLKSMLEGLHSRLFAKQTGTASYLLGIASHGKLTIAYEGDCSCGVLSFARRIEWFTPPHCKANWKRDRSHRDLAVDPARNLMTRGFRANRLPAPDFVRRSIAAGDRLIFATDGFWAELSDARQLEMLRSPACNVAEANDDVTWIDVEI
jgi:serine/threonine protein phosphatase PrpC